jgi:hypothetical protein
MNDWTKSVVAMVEKMSIMGKDIKCIKIEWKIEYGSLVLAIYLWSQGKDVIIWLEENIERVPVGDCDLDDIYSLQSFAFPPSPTGRVCCRFVWPSSKQWNVDINSAGHI